MTVFGMVTLKSSARYTPCALASFFKETSLSPRDRFILIDNDGGFDESLLQGFPAVGLVRNESPRSFAANVNSVMEIAADARDDLLFLNNDIIFGKGWLPPLLCERKAVYIPASNAQLPYSTPSLAFKLTMDLGEYLGRERDFEAIVERHRATTHGYRLAHTIPYYCVRIPRAVYEEVGAFDESLSPSGCWEDTDYTIRCYERGIPLFYAVDSLILHFYGKSTWSRPMSPAEKAERDREEAGVHERFRAKWGSELMDLFGFQRPEALERLRVLEEESKVALYGSVARRRGIGR